MKLTPGMLYKTKTSAGLFYKRHGDPICDLLIIPVNQVLLFIREESIIINGCSCVAVYFLYEHRIVYDHRYNIKRVFSYLEKLI